MRVFFPKINIEIEIQEGRCCGLLIEENGEYRSIVRELWEQSTDNSECITFSTNQNQLKIGKEVEIIINPFDLDINNKKILNKVYGEITKVVTEELNQDFAEINQRIIALLDHVTDRLSYSLDYALEPEIKQLLKCYSVSVDDYCENLTERLITYIQFSSMILGTKVFVFVQCLNYLSAQEVDYIKECIAYTHSNALFLECMYDSFPKAFGKCVIYDRDKCVIHIEI